MTNLDLFADLGHVVFDHVKAESLAETNARALARIGQLSYQADFVSRDEAEELLEFVDQNSWLLDLERRVQHYGYKYDYKARRVDATMHLGPLPAWLMMVANRLVVSGFFATPPDQVIVNEYQPGQGITPHVDCEPCFGPVIASLTLGSGCAMEFTRLTNNEKIEVYLQERSLVVLDGESRYDWRHGIAKRKNDLFAGERLPRRRRVSLTFRNVIRS